MSGKNVVLELDVNINEKGEYFRLVLAAYRPHAVTSIDPFRCQGPHRDTVDAREKGCNLTREEAYTFIKNQQKTQDHAFCIFSWSDNYGWGEETGERDFLDECELMIAEARDAKRTDRPHLDLNVYLGEASPNQLHHVSQLAIICMERDLLPEAIQVLIDVAKHLKN